MTDAVKNALPPPTLGLLRVDPGNNCDIQTADGRLEIASTHPGTLTGGEKPHGIVPQANAAAIVTRWNSHAALVEALKPLARVAEAARPSRGDDFELYVIFHADDRLAITLGHARAALAALKAAGEV